MKKIKATKMILHVTKEISCDKDEKIESVAFHNYLNLFIDYFPENLKELIGKVSSWNDVEKLLDFDVEASYIEEFPDFFSHMLIWTENYVIQFVYLEGLLFPIAAPRNQTGFQNWLDRPKQELRG